MTVTINGTTGYTGPIGAIGDLSTTGNTTLGDASGDTLTINGSTTTFTQGTANGVAYLNGSKVLTTGSALVFDGTNLGVGIASPAQKLDVYGTGMKVNNASYVGYLGAGNTFAGGSASDFCVRSDNVLSFATGGPYERVRIDTSGNLGIGVTPSAWSGISAIQFNNGSLSWSTNRNYINSNAFWNGSNWVRTTTGGANQFITSWYDNSFTWNYAGSGSSGATVSWTSGMTLTSEGRLLVGTTSYKANAYLTVNTSQQGAVFYSGSSTYNELGVWSGASDELKAVIKAESGLAKFGSRTNSPVVFQVNDTEVGRFSTSGYLGIGNTSPGFALDIATTNAGSIAWQRTGVSAKRWGITSDNSNTYLRNESDSVTVMTFANGGTSTANGYFVANSRLYATTGMQIVTPLYLAGSGATYDAPTTGYRMVESYGAQWVSGGSVWHHSLINSSYIAGFGPSGSNYGSGNCYLTGTLSQNYSDIRLKNDLGTIENALDKVMTLRGFRYTINALGKELGFNDDGVEAGLSAQDVQAVLPEAVMLAGSDMAPGPDGETVSKSGEYYLTLRYDRVVPLLVNAIKELKAEFDAYKLTHP